MARGLWALVVRLGFSTAALISLAACATQESLQSARTSSSPKPPVRKATPQKPGNPNLLARLFSHGPNPVSPQSSQPLQVQPKVPAVKKSALPVPAPDSGSLVLFSQVPDDPSIQLYIDYFRYADHHRFKEWLERSHEYLPYIRQVLRENGLPPDLAYVSLIESGFSARAYSRTGASGLWQFMRGTGVKYGLTVNWWIDQRRDPILSTKSAALYLKDLYSEFHSWELALAAYNSGEGRMANAIARCGTKDYWKIRQTHYISSETRSYVPKMIAAMVIAKDPEKYGFSDLSYHPAVRIRQKTITHPVEIRQLAHAMNMSLSEFLVYNPQFTRWATPPRLSSVSVNVPEDLAKGFSKRLSRLPRTKINPDVPVYRVESGDSLWSIAHRFHVSLGDLLAVNRLSSRRLKLRQKLIIPKSDTLQEPRQLVARIHHNHYHSGKARFAGGDGWIDHRIRRGDSLYLLARRYNTSIGQIRAKNHIHAGRSLKIGQHILIPVH